MKGKKSLLFVIFIIAVAALAIAGWVYAGALNESGCATQTIVPDKSAPGAQFSGTLSIYFTVAENGSGSCDGYSDAPAYWVLRILKGPNQYVYDGEFDANICDPPYYCPCCPEGSYKNSIQYKLLQNVPWSQVLSDLGYDPSTANYALQNYSNYAQSIDASAFTMDFVLAIAKK